MPRANPITVAWNAGEFSPRMVARVDFNKYDNAASLLENLLPLPQGGLTRRPGSRFVAEAKDSSTLAILIPFQFSTEQAYMLEFGDQYIRVYRNQGQVLSGGSPVEIASPYLEADLYELKFAQSADVMWLVHPNYKPKKLSRTSHTAWTLTDYTPTGDPFTSTDNYPSAVGFFEQRIVFAATNADPQKIRTSKTGDFENLTLGPNDDDAISFVIAAGEQGKVNRIRWISAGRQLLLGTVGGEFVVESDGPVLTPSDFNVRQHTAIGSADLSPIRISHFALFVQRARRKLHELAFTIEIDGLDETDLTVLADHVLSSGVVQLAYQQEPDSVVWCARADGVLAALTYKREHDVVGWSRHVMGGTFGSGSAVVESVATIPGGTGQFYASTDRDEVWVVVKRTIDGQTKRYVEVLEGLFTGPTREDYDTEAEWTTAMLAAQKDAFYVDCGFTYDGAATSTITGLGAIEGEWVKVLGDGAVLPDVQVVGGQITLGTTVSRAHIGLVRKWRFSTLKLPYGAAAGTAVGKMKRVHQVTAVLESSGTFRCGARRGDLLPVEFRVVGDLMDTAVPLFTGEKVIPFPGGHGRDERIHLEGDSPEPWTLLALAPEMQTMDLK